MRISGKLQSPHLPGSFEYRFPEKTEAQENWVLPSESQLEHKASTKIWEFPDRGANLMLSELLAPFQGFHLHHMHHL